MSTPQPAQPALATPACLKPGITSIICPLLCVSLFVFFAQNTGKTSNGKMPATAYLCWAFVMCYVLSTLSSIYNYFTAPPCPAQNTS